MVSVMLELELAVLCAEAAMPVMMPLISLGAVSESESASAFVSVGESMLQAVLVM
jgi:hypothetical protein